MSRIDYAVKTIDSAAHLLASCDDVAQMDAIIGRMTTMLNKVWAFEHRTILREAPAESWNAASGVFWDGVHTGLVATGKLHAFSAVYGEEVNPPGQAGNVVIYFQPLKVVSRFVANLSIPKNDAELRALLR